MTSKRPISPELLSAWVDGEAGDRTAEVTERVANDPELASRADELRQSGGALRAMVDDALGPVDPLLALAHIRQRVAERRQRSLSARVSAWWSDVTTYHRRAFAGVAVAMALGAISAPGVVWITGHTVTTSSPDISQTSATDNAAYVPAAEAPVVLTIRFVQAHDRDSVTDARLAEIADAVKRPGASGYALAGESAIRAEAGSSSRIDMPHGGVLELRPRGTVSGLFRIDVDIPSRDVHTTLNLAPGATATVDSATDADGASLVAITRE